MSNGTTPPKQAKGSPQIPPGVPWVGVVVTSSSKGLVVDIPNHAHHTLHAEAGRPVVWRFENATDQPMELGVGGFESSPRYKKEKFRYPLKKGRTSVPVGARGTEILTCEILPRGQLDFFGHPSITYKYNIENHGKSILDPDIEIPNQ